MSYEGRDGLRHEMTYIDLDPKTKIGTGKLTEEELSTLQEKIKEDKMLQILAILALPASSVSGKHEGMYDKYIGRSVDETKIVWRNEMVMDACMIDDILRFNLFNCAWKGTISPADWHVDLSYQEIIDGEWNKLHLAY